MTSPSAEHADVTTVRRLLWLYCILWLFEGALRKWVFPQFSMHLLLVRDPIAILIYLSASRARVLPMNGWLGYLGFLAGLIFLQAIVHLMLQDVSLVVAIFGVRTFFLHLPLIWVVAEVFGRKDIVSLGRWVLIIAPFLAVLMVVQFELPREHWLNAASIKGGSQIGSVGEKIRPAALFSFITGPIHFFALCSAFTIGGVLTKGLFPRWLLGAGAVSIMVAMSVSGSRALVLASAVVAAAGTAAALLSGKRVGAIVGMGIGLTLTVALLSTFGVMKEGIAAFTERWVFEDESGASGSKVMTQRVGGSFLTAFAWARTAPITGFGVGISSNLATEHKNFESAVEQEWDRVIYEVGAVTGFMYLAFRTGFAFRMLALGYRAVRSGNFLCGLFGAACFFDMLFGNLRQVTTYGYTCICAGLCLAAHKAFSEDEEAPIVSEVEDVMQEKPKARGRGRFAVGGAPVRS